MLLTCCSQQGEARLLLLTALSAKTRQALSSPGVGKGNSCQTYSLSCGDGPSPLVSYSEGGEGGSCQLAKDALQAL